MKRERRADSALASKKQEITASRHPGRTLGVEGATPNEKVSTRKERGREEALWPDMSPAACLGVG